VVGHRAAAVATLGGSNAPWWIAGVAMFGLILVVGWSAVSRSAASTAPGGGMPPGAAGNPAAGQSTLDLNSMTPREAADRLFNRVMQTMAAGDTTNALFFQPMAVEAYQRAEPLDLDGIIHEALLEMLTDPAAALATSERVLQSEPDHVLGLGTAGRAAIAMGDSAKAKEYYEHLLRVYDTEYARNLVEYDGHRQLMDEMQNEAQRYLGSG
jgi:tetratricopeptide (TPR) repeat protein